MNKIKSSIIVAVALIGLFVGANTTFARTPDVTCNSATVYGNVYPQNTTVSIWFEWGTSRATVQNGGGTKIGQRQVSYDTEISAGITGLNQNTTYYYRSAMQDGPYYVPATTESFTTLTSQAQTYTVNTNVTSGNGSFSPTSRQVTSGNTTSFNLIPGSGYSIGGASGCNGYLSRSTFYTGAITSNCTVSASFVQNQPTTYTVTPNAGAGGYISPSLPQQVSSGNTTSFSVIPNSGYSIDNVTSSCGGNLSGTTYTTGPITYNCSVYASFIKKENISVHLTADETSAVYGGSTTLHWQTSGSVSSCTATQGNGNWYGTKNLSGSQNTGALYADTTFGITCYGTPGSSEQASDSVKVNISSQPVASGTLYLSPYSCVIPQGVSTCTVQASWTTTNTNSASLVDGNTGNTLDTLLNRYSYNPKQVWVTYPSTNFILKGAGPTLDSKTATASCASGTHWENSRCTKDFIDAPVTVHITADNSNVAYGGSTTLRWTNSSSVTTCTATGGTSNWNGTKNPNSSASTGPLYADTTFGITCYGGSGQSASDSLRVYVNNNNNDRANPTVNTRSPSNVNFDSATLRGFVNSNGGDRTRAWFEWGTSSSNYSNQTTSVYYGSTSGSYFEYTIRGLSSDRTYYYRAVAQNDYGDVEYGSRESFRTDRDNDNCSGSNNCNGDIPYVTTYSATAVSDNYATLNGLSDANDSATDTWFEWGTSYSNLNRSTSKDYQGTGRDNFNDRITGLSPNTTYYFRAVARNSEGTARGNILSFRTSGAVIIPVGECGAGFSTCEPTAVSIIASNISQSSARLNAMAYIPLNVYTTGFFEYGPNPSLGLSTLQKSIGTISPTPFSESLSNLAPNTVYYYRAVVSNQYGISRGDILSFRTGNLIVYTDTTTGSNVIYRNTTLVSNTSSTTNTGNNVGTSRSSLVYLSVSRDEEVVRRGDIVDYIINYKNVSTQNLRNIVLRVAIPGEFEFMETTRGAFALEDNMVVVNIGNLFPQEEGSVRITVAVKEDAEIGKSVVVTANLAYTIVDTGVQEEVFAYSRNTIADGRLGLGAAAIFGAGFLPSNLLGWLLLILIILLLIAAVRWLYERPRVVVAQMNQQPENH